jgi:hypothetical protein
LDDYIEAQVHRDGGVQLARDVEALVLDPCFRGTGVETLARKMLPASCALEWHPGFRLNVKELALPEHAAYRGADVLALAIAIGSASPAKDGVLTPTVLGDALRSGCHDPKLLKKVWHILARFGRQIEPKG